MGKYKVKRQGEWWQVVNENGHAIAQSRSRAEMDGYKFMLENNRGMTPLSMPVVNQHRGYTVRTIKKYP